jgi:23S rRNA-/tRNA-specific pseudouridylate synthase
VKKTYFAIVSGKLLNKGMLQHRIWKDDETKRMFCFDMDEVKTKLK